MNQQQNNAPLDKGRVTYIAEKYQTNEGEKNRYATLGRATKWPSQNGGEPDIQIELDSVPLTPQSPLKLFIFWDSQQQNQQPQQAGGFQGQQQGYQPQAGGYRGQ